MFSMSRALGGYARWSVDRSAEALEAIVEATTWLEASDSRQFLSLNYGWLTEAMVFIGDYPAARRYAARAVLRAREGDRMGEAMAQRALARAAVAGHGRRTAGWRLERAMASARARGSAHEQAKTRLCAAEIALTEGDPGRATTLLAQARPGLEAMKMG